MSNEIKRIENVEEVTTRLLGAIEPQGETNIDNVRHDNLKQTIELTESLIDKIILVARHKDAPEYSMSRSGKEANEFINRLKEQVED